MKIRVAVVDDEPLGRSSVIERLRFQEDVAVAGEYGDGKAALEALRTGNFDLVFMDVQMPHMSGLEVLAAVPREQRPLSILLTAHESFAVRAFELDVVDYLLKPVDEERFAESLGRARRALSRPSVPANPANAVAELTNPYLSRFSVRVGRRTLIVPAAEVEWIDADGDYATLHTGERTYLVRESLQKLAGLLDPILFVRVHRSAIVRVDFVAEIQPLSNRDALLRLRDGTPLRASRTYVGELVSLLGGR